VDEFKLGWRIFGEEILLDRKYYLLSVRKLCMRKREGSAPNLFKGSRVGFAEDTGSSDVEVPIFRGVDQRNLYVWYRGKDFLCNSNPTV
jgi:hypothetical protein